jgi:hypothetical protein
MSCLGVIGGASPPQPRGLSPFYESCPYFALGYVLVFLGIIDLVMDLQEGSVLGS